MVSAFVLIAAAATQPATPKEFAEQAARCGVPLEYQFREPHYLAKLDDDGRSFAIYRNQGKERVDCMVRWAKSRNLMAVVWQD